MRKARALENSRPRWSFFSRLAVIGFAVFGLVGVGLLSEDPETSEAKPRPALAFEEELESEPSSVEKLTDRAFWGAPPPMPHGFTREWDTESCLRCHAITNDISRRHQALSPIPHAVLSQCQQCHVRQVDSEDDLFVLSEFIGVGFPGKGSRATPVAPPTIPHQTFMRENCNSCHGPAGEQRIVTPHPYRSQCRQCHVSDLDREYSRSPLR